MHTKLIAGLLWILVAGITQGAFVLPMKYTRAWKWEHLWFWYSAIAFLVLPVVTALLTVPHLGQALSSAPPRQLVLTALFGLGWGAGSVFFGLGVDALGMALGFSMMTALYTALGAFIPLVILTPDMLFRYNGLMVIAGNGVTAVGVVVCSIAGERRDKQLGAQGASGIIGPRRAFAVALVICILSGVLSAALNFGYAFGDQITKTAERLGATPDNAVNVIWLVLIPAGGLINVGYCLFLLWRNKSWDPLVRRATWVDWLDAWIMGVLWTGSVIIYGWGANNLGRLGPSLGWSLWNAILIATTFVCGLLTREWKGVQGRPLQLLYLGIGVLVAGMFVLGLGV